MVSILSVRNLRTLFRLATITSAMIVCRLCSVEVKQNHSVSLVSPLSLKTDLLGRLSKMMVYVSTSAEHDRTLFD